MFVNICLSRMHPHLYIYSELEELDNIVEDGEENYEEYFPARYFILIKIMQPSQQIIGAYEDKTYLSVLGL